MSKENLVNEVLDLDGKKFKFDTNDNLEKYLTQVTQSINVSPYIIDGKTRSCKMEVYSGNLINNKLIAIILRTFTK